MTDEGPRFVDGAAVLVESVRRQPSRYGVAFVAIVSPRIGEETERKLRYAGFSEILRRSLPIEPALIEGRTLRKLWTNDTRKGGCCGAWELLKLYAWTLTKYRRVVHVDVDALLLGGIDELFEADADLVYTADYNMMSDRQREKGVSPAVQGGFLVVRPSLAVFDALRNVSQAGRWSGEWGPGWERSNVGSWWGGSTIQGLLPFVFGVKYNASAESEVSFSSLEVDRCVYDNMADRPVPGPRVGQVACRDADLGDVKFFHFTVCQKPWRCAPNPEVGGLCPQLHLRWFAYRADLERRLGLPHADACTKRGRYVPIAFPTT